MIEGLEDDRIQKILSLDGDAESWSSDLARLQRGDDSLTRASAGEDGIIAVQRMLIFLGYSTDSSGAFRVDGDFGRGTNRGVAQFQFEHGLNSKIKRGQLCYACTFSNARTNIKKIPEARLDATTMRAMVASALDAIEKEEVPLGRFEDALFHLNAVHRGDFLKCRQILEHYGRAAEAAAKQVREEEGVEILPEWILSIIRQETAGIVRPRFEQHVLTRRNKKSPRADLDELRYQSMSIGLGQVMGFNYKRVGAESARAMVTSPIEEQVLYVARFVAQPSVAKVVAKREPTDRDFRTLARSYNGPKYEKHHYHERIARWFREFRTLMG